MSCHGLEWHGRCIPIYLMEVNWRHKIPQPDPPGPHPDPWDELFGDLTTLVTINDGIGHIRDERVRKSMLEAVQAAARSLKLPDGMKLGDGLFRDQKAFMAAAE